MNQKTKFKQTEIGLIPEDWEIKELQTTVSKLGDGLHGTPKYNKKGPYYFINGNNLVEGKIKINSNTKKCPEKEFEKYKKELNNRTIFVSINGTLGNIALYNHEKVILGKSACYFNVKEEFNILFIKYVLKNSYFQNYILSNATGTTIKNVSLKQMREFKFGIPKNHKEQKAIAKILSDLDSKIELLQKQNETLEKIGSTIFKQWFVDFEFPNEEGKPYKSSGGEMVDSELGEIPKDWSVGYLGDNNLTKIQKSGISNFQDEKIYLDTASVQDFEIVDKTTKITIKEKPSRANMQPKPNTVWFAKMKDSRKLLFFDTFSDYDINRFILSTGFAGLEVKNYSLYYVWTFVLSDKFDIEKNNLCQGTTMQAINNENIMKIKILNLPKEVLQKFNKVVRSAFEKTYYNSCNIEYLIEIRDLLLPKFMSGKIRVRTND